MKKALTWLDSNILIVLSGFLLAFIPLYPKLPLFDILPGYIVRVRIEDFLILAAGLIWFAQTIRGKVKWKSPVFWAMAVYAVIGLLSAISAALITKTVPAQLLHIGKTMLHFFRYLEYFSLFPILYAALETKKQARILLGILATSVLAITIYGYGQRYLFWPVYSTMNREFSKGIRLYLTEHARVQSTFGGHYDLAAYLVVFLPLLLAAAFQVKHKALKISLHLIHLAGLWLIIESASRVSFAAYLVGLAVVLVVTALTKTSWLQKIVWGTSRSFAAGLIVMCMVAIFGSEIYMRFVQVIQGYPAAYSQYQVIEKAGQKVVDMISPLLANPSDIFKAKKPENAVAAADPEQIEAEVVKNALVPSDERPTPTRPNDVFIDVPETVQVATISASGSATTITVTKDRTFSDCALTKGLSECIRYETLWPLAIAGFKRNPLLGSGYATLTKNNVGEFTEAESTDNNFLRTLGETGLLGFLSFYGIILLINWLLYKSIVSDDWLAKTLGIGFLAGSIGLLVNATYIDVYASSKVAQSYWALAGLALGYAYINHTVGGPLKLPFLASYEAEAKWLAATQTPLAGDKTLHIPLSKPFSRRLNRKGSKRAAKI